MMQLKRGRKMCKRVAFALSIVGKPNPDSPTGENFTVFQAAKRAGVSDSSIYYHWKKQRLVLANSQVEEGSDYV